MLFADVRGSTALAESMSTREFQSLMTRFYGAANQVLVHTDAFVDKLVGDEVIGLYIPGIAGEDHARRAIDGAKELLRATGHGRKGGPWVPVGVGVHTGEIYLGTVGAEGTYTDFSMLGDPVNVTARLASNAAEGEVLVSDDARAAVSYDVGGAEQRDLSLKGRDESVNVSVLHAAE